jgi:hypothetical protein
MAVWLIDRTHCKHIPAEFSPSLLVARYHPVLLSLAAYNNTLDPHLAYTDASID